MPISRVVIIGILVTKIALGMQKYLNSYSHYNTTLNLLMHVKNSITRFKHYSIIGKTLSQVNYSCILLKLLAFLLLEEKQRMIAIYCRMLNYCTKSRLK